MGIYHSKTNFGKKKQKKTNRSNPKLWNSVVNEVKRSSKGGLPGQWSARKAQLAVHLYKKKGGTYKGKRNKNNKLTKWTKENWGTKSGKNSIVGKNPTYERYLPKKKRKKLTKKEYNKTSYKKKRDAKKGKQYSKQPKKVSEKLKS